MATKSKKSGKKTTAKKQTTKRATKQTKATKRTARKSSAVKRTMKSVVSQTTSSPVVNTSEVSVATPSNEITSVEVTKS